MNRESLKSAHFFIKNLKQIYKLKKKRKYQPCSNLAMKSSEIFKFLFNPINNENELKLAYFYFFNNLF